MSSADRIQNAGTSQTIEYTVHQTAKVHREKEKDRRPPIYLSVVKWLVGIFLFFAVLTCLVASKVSLLSIAYYKEKTAETSFIMIVLTLMIPEAVSFFRACWTSLFRPSHKWPRTRAILVVSTYLLHILFLLCGTNCWKFHVFDRAVARLTFSFFFSYNLGSRRGIMIMCRSNSIFNTSSPRATTRALNKSFKCPIIGSFWVIKYPHL